MKKMLSILRAVSLITTGTSSVVACKSKEETKTKKNNLNTINKLSLDIIHEKNKKLYDLNSKIINANEFRNKPLNKNYIINYFSNEDLNNKNDISDFPQAENTAIYVVIIVSKNDITWEGQTSRLKVVMK